MQAKYLMKRHISRESSLSHTLKRAIHILNKFLLPWYPSLRPFSYSPRDIHPSFSWIFLDFFGRSARAPEAFQHLLVHVCARPLSRRLTPLARPSSLTIVCLLLLVVLPFFHSVSLCLASLLFV